VTSDELAAFARRLFEAYGAGDVDGFRALLADDLIAYVTNAAAGVDELRGVEAYMSRLPDLHAAGGHLLITQVLPVDDARVLTMVEIRAERATAGSCTTSRPSSPRWATARSRGSGWSTRCPPTATSSGLSGARRRGAG
jgi:hypothetical protein